MLFTADCTASSESYSPPGPAVLDLISNAWVTQAVYAATKLGIIEALRDGPQTADAVADGVGANPDAVSDSMRGYLLFVGDPLHWEH